MIVRDRSVPSRVDGVSRRQMIVEGADELDRPGRLIPMLMALYLTPALLVVLLVGGIGMVVLAVARMISFAVHGPGAWRRGPIGPGSPGS